MYELEDIHKLMSSLSDSFDTPKKLDGEQYITDEEGKTLISSLATERNGNDFTNQEAMQVVKWAVDIRWQYEMLGLVLKGLALITVQNGEVAFRLAPGVKFEGDPNAKD